MIVIKLIQCTDRSKANAMNQDCRYFNNRYSFLIEEIASYKEATKNMFSLNDTQIKMKLTVKSLISNQLCRGKDPASSGFSSFKVLRSFLL